MKENFKPALRLFLRMVVVTLMNIFLCISMVVLSTAMFSNVIGYDATVYEEDSGKHVATYSYLYDDGDDLKKSEYEEQGYIVKTFEKRSDFTTGGKIALYTVIQLLALAIVTSFIYPKLWQMGCRDSNLVRFKHKEPDNLRGLKIGLLSVIPNVLTNIVLIIFAGKLSIGMYALLNANIYSLLVGIGGFTGNIKDLAIWQIILMLMCHIFVPLVAYISYLLGYKDISLFEKAVYKKKK